MSDAIEEKFVSHVDGTWKVGQFGSAPAFSINTGVVHDKASVEAFVRSRGLPYDIVAEAVLGTGKAPVTKAQAGGHKHKKGKAAE